MSVMSLVLSFAILASGPHVKSDEVITFYPTYGAHDIEGGMWNVQIHGSIYEPEADSIKRAIALRVFRKFLGLPKDSPETDNFQKRARLFLVDDTEDRKIAIRFDSQVYPVGKSGDDGHFSQILSLPDQFVDGLPKDRQDGLTCIHYQAVTKPDDTRKFTGRVLLVPPTGLSVISDIDDTIKITNVLNRQAMIANTFLHDYKAVPGMADLYRRWAKQGAVYHYVSGSPWPLYRPLSEFLQSAGFPAGTFHLRSFQWFGAASREMFSAPEKMKLQVIEEIFRDFPGRKFILVGDSTEKDPEVYGHFARRYPDQVVHIYIRNVTRESPGSDRFNAAFLDVPASRWTLFIEPTSLPHAVSPTSSATSTSLPHDRRPRVVP